MTIQPTTHIDFIPCFYFLRKLIERQLWLERERLAQIEWRAKQEKLERDLARQKLYEVVAFFMNIRGSGILT